MSSAPDLFAATLRARFPGMPGAEVNGYREQGWPADQVADVAAAVIRLTQWAVQQGTGPAWLFPNSVLTDQQQWADRCDWVGRMWRRLETRHDMPHALAQQWVTVAVCASPDADLGALEFLFRALHPETASTMAAWRRIGLAGPLAFAAGLDVQEAYARKAHEDLQDATLRALAALRGYRFPADFLVSPDAPALPFPAIPGIL